MWMWLCASVCMQIILWNMCGVKTEISIQGFLHLTQYRYNSDSLYHFQNVRGKKESKADNAALTLWKMNTETTSNQYVLKMHILTKQYIACKITLSYLFSSIFESIKYLSSHLKLR